MGETAEERRRRLALQGSVDCFNLFDTNDYRIRYRIFNRDDMVYYKQLLDDVCEEVIEKVREKTDVSLVKEYSKGTFKFVDNDFSSTESYLDILDII